jgi:hypothetical protein
MADVLGATYAGVECQFFFSPGDGRLARMEFYPYAAAEPCVLLFSGYEEIDGRWMPRQIDVVHGDRRYASFRFTRFELATTDHQAEPKP